MGRNTPESPGNAKKRRRTSTAASLPQSSPVPDLVPPPLSCYGDTVFASNPFDDASSTSAPMQMPNMGHMGHMGMMPRGMAPGMQGNMGPGPSGPMGPGPMGPGSMGPGGPMGPMGPNSMNGPMGPGMGPGPNMGPGMPGGNGMGPGMPGGNGMGPMVPRMSVPNSMSGSQIQMNSIANSMNPMTSMGNNMHEMNMQGMGHGGGPGMPGPGPSGMPPNSIPNSSRKVYPADQPMVFNPQNPNAPPIYPCGMCHKEVHENDQAILCESGCNFWFHRMCTGLIEQAYHLLIAEVYAEWVCDRCLSTKSIPLIKFKP